MAAADPWVQETSLTLGDVVRLLGRRKMAIAAIALAIFTVVAAWAFLVPPQYRATVTVMPASRGQMLGQGGLGQLGGIAPLAGIDFGRDDAGLEESLAVLKSRDFGMAFVADRNLLQRFFADRWDASAGVWRPSWWRDAPTPASGYRYFDREILEVTRDRRTGLIAVSVTWKDRNEAAVWANEIVARLNAEMRRRASENAEASLAFLERERQQTQYIATQESINRLIEKKVSERMLASVTPEYSLRIIDRALAPDPAETATPSKFILLSLGAIAGLVAGCLFVLAYVAVTAGAPGRASNSSRD